MSSLLQSLCRGCSRLAPASLLSTRGLFAQPLCSSLSTKGESEGELLRRKLNKLRYRSQQRGLLEMDILLAKWTETALQTMDSEKLDAFEAFMMEETPSLYKWVTGQEQFPARLHTNKSFMEFYGFVQNKVKDNCTEASRNKSHAEWLRGWHDKGNQN